MNESVRSQSIPCQVAMPAERKIHTTTALLRGSGRGDEKPSVETGSQKVAAEGEEESKDQSTHVELHRGRNLVALSE